jgi:hypothetical protein
VVITDAWNDIVVQNKRAEHLRSVSDSDSPPAPRGRGQQPAVQLLPLARR